MGDRRFCPECGVSVKLENLPGHYEKQHPRLEMPEPLTHEAARAAKPRPPATLSTRREKRRYLAAAIIVLIVVLAAVLLQFVQWPRAGTGIEVPSDCGTFRLSDHRGQVVLLDFMFVNCEACRISMPHLVALRNAFGPDVLTMISIDLVPTETEGMLAAFRDEFGATWHFAFDRTGELQLEYKVEIFPSLMIIKPSGKVAFAAPGVTESALLISAVRAVAR